MDVIDHRVGNAPVLDVGTELSIVRIVQESLTNVLKHTDGADAIVTLTFADDVTVEVTDSGRATHSPRRPEGAGRGLIGMRERVDALGGTLTARPFAGRGFTVRAVIPTERSDDLDVAATMPVRS